MFLKDRVLNGSNSPSQLSFPTFDVNGWTIENVEPCNDVGIFTAVVIEPTSPSVDEELNVAPSFSFSTWSDVYRDGMLGDGEPSSSGNNLVIHQLVELPSQLPSPTEAMLIEARHNGNRPNQSLQAGRYAILTNHVEFVHHEVLALVRRPWQKFLSRFSKPDQKILQKLHRKQQCKQYSASNRAKKISHRFAPNPVLNYDF